MKKVIYTAIFGPYDEVKEPIFVNDDFDYILLTDQDIQSEVWQVIKYKSDYKETPVRMARMMKVNSHKIFPEYGLTVWMDANIQQTKDINIHINKMTTDMLVLKHPHRNCVYEELKACIMRKKDDPGIMLQQVNRYKQNKYRENNGLAATGLIIRKHTEKIRAFNERWWKEIQSGSYRDQLSFNYCLNGLKINYIPFDTLYSHFNFHRHIKNT